MYKIAMSLLTLCLISTATFAQATLFQSNNNNNNPANSNNPPLNTVLTPQQFDSAVNSQSQQIQNARNQQWQQQLANTPPIKPQAPPPINSNPNQAANPLGTGPAGNNGQAKPPQIAPPPQLPPNSMQKPNSNGQKPLPPMPGTGNRATPKSNMLAPSKNPANKPPAPPQAPQVQMPTQPNSQPTPTQTPSANQAQPFTGFMGNDNSKNTNQPNSNNQGGWNINY
jgi:hypothetical protein